ICPTLILAAFDGAAWTAAGCQVVLISPAVVQCDAVCKKSRRVEDWVMEISLGSTARFRRHTPCAGYYDHITSQPGRYDFVSMLLATLELVIFIAAASQASVSRGLRMAIVPSNTVSVSGP